MSTWIPISERLPTREDADELGEVVWKWAHGGKSSARFNSHPEDAVAWLPLPRYTPPKPGPTNTECANILHYSALACMNHLDPKNYSTELIAEEEEVGDNKWQKWRADLAALGGWENEMVSVPAGAVREMIVAGEAHYARLARAEAAIREQPTLRDRFAMAALAGMLACGHRNYGTIDDVLSYASRVAYEYADAMLAEREKEPQ